MIDLVGRTHLLDAPGIHHHDTIGEVQRLFLIVRDQDGGQVRGLVKQTQPFAQFKAHARVERAKGFVQEQEPGPRRQCSCEAHPLSLSARQLAGIPVAVAFQLDQFEQLGYTSIDLILGRPLRSQPKRDVLAHCHVPKQGETLKHQTEAAFLHRNRRDVLASHQHAARVRRLESRDDSQNGGLARTRRAEQGGDAAGRSLEVGLEYGRGSLG